MSSRSLGPLAVLVALWSCGGRVGGASAPADGTVGPDGGSAPGSASPQSCVAGGVRLCGGACKWLDGATCPPSGCEAISGLGGETSAAGVCWSDDPEATVSCATCADGDACLQRSSSALVCVPADVCYSLWREGYQNVCRYADKAAFDDRPLPVATGCPAGAPPVVCGGDCPACGSSLGTRCIGRSPDHPFGLCAELENDSNPADPGLLRTCSLVGNKYRVGCPWGGSSSAPSYSCAVFRTGPADQAAAKAAGLCMRAEACQAAAVTLPGGLDCYGENGTL
jgi:hypothetical protein